MTKKIKLDVLNKVSDGIEFKDLKVSGSVGKFLMVEEYVEGSIWQVDTHGVDFTDEKSVKKFLEESSDDGTSESFDTFEDAQIAFNIFN